MSEESEIKDDQDRWDLLAKDLLGGDEGLDKVVDLENLEEEELSTQFPLPRNDRDELSDSNPDMEESLDDEEDESIELMLGSDVDLDQIIDPDSEETIQNTFGMGIDLDDSSEGASDPQERTKKKSSRSRRPRRRRSAPESEEAVVFEEAAPASEEVIDDPVESVEAVDDNAFGMGIDLDDSSEGASDPQERTKKKSSRSRRPRRRRSAPESEEAVVFEEAAPASEERGRDPVGSQSSSKKADQIPSWSEAIACLKRGSSHSGSANSRNSNSNRRRSKGSSRQSS